MKTTDTTGEKVDSVPYFLGTTLDDVMRLVVSRLLSNGKLIHPSQGSCIELTGVLLEIENPRARLSRTEIKGKLFSSIGELCWYLAKNNNLDFISYYIPKYKKYADGNIIHGGYGPRLFNLNGVNQVNQIITRLKTNSDSRKAVIQVFDALDLVKQYNDVPCTCIMQFMVRDNKLNMITYMRSNDWFLGLPHDVFCFTMIQEIIARTLSIELGYYKHFVGSLHLYQKDNEKATQFLEEGWQSTDLTMPLMPIGDPWLPISILIKAEFEIRKTGELSVNYKDLDPYWVDFIRLLKIFQYWGNNNKQEIVKIQNTMVSKIYNLYIESKLSQI